MCVCAKFRADPESIQARALSLSLCCGRALSNFGGPNRGHEFPPVVLFWLFPLPPRCRGEQRRCSRSIVVVVVAVVVRGGALPIELPMIIHAVINYSPGLMDFDGSWRPDFFLSRLY